MKKLFFALIIFLAGSTVFAQSLPRMKDKYVTDAADILSRSELKQLRSDVKSMCDYYSTRIVVGIVPTFGDYEIDEYAGELAEKWELSDENTMFILVKPKSDEERGEAMLLASSDLEDVFTSDVCDNIVHDQMIPHFKTDDYFGGIEAALEYMNKMSDEDATEKETETVVASTSSDNGERTSSKFMEFISNLGVGIATIIKWILIIIVIVAVIGVIAWFVIKKKDEIGESSNLMRSNLSSINNSDEIPTAIVDKKQEIEKRKREIEELKNLERESQELDDEYDNIQANSERRRRRDYDDYDTRDHYDDRRLSLDVEDILGKMSQSNENKGEKILGTIGKVAGVAAGVAGAAAIGKKVRENRKNNKDDDGGLLGNIGSFFKKKSNDTSNAPSGKPKLGGNGKPKASGSGNKPKLGGSGSKSKPGGNSSSGGW